VMGLRDDGAGTVWHAVEHTTPVKCYLRSRLKFIHLC
jgi:hypothetical protein